MNNRASTLWLCADRRVRSPQSAERQDDVHRDNQVAEHGRPRQKQPEHNHQHITGKPGREPPGEHLDVSGRPRRSDTDVGHSSSADRHQRGRDHEQGS